MKELIIIGAGPSGLSAALYAKRSGLDMMIIESNYMAGGQVLTTYEVDNYLGMPGSNGFDMGMKFKEHVETCGVEISNLIVERIENKTEYFEVYTDQGVLETRTVLLATGAVNRKLDIPGEELFIGKGVGYCATCDGAFYRDKTVAVVGGSYQAVEDAIYLAGLCKKVYLIHRRDRLRAGALLEEKVKKLANVEFVWNSIALEIKGTESVEEIVVQDVRNHEQRQIALDGVFVAIGTSPSTELAKGLVEMTEEGYVAAGESCETNIPGFFVAGDIRTKQLRQIVTAVADGANAATSVWNYLKK